MRSKDPRIPRSSKDPRIPCSSWHPFVRPWGLTRSLLASPGRRGCLPPPQGREVTTYAPFDLRQGVRRVRRSGFRGKTSGRPSRARRPAACRERRGHGQVGLASGLAQTLSRYRHSGAKPGGPRALLTAGLTTTRVCCGDATCAQPDRPTSGGPIGLVQGRWHRKWRALRHPARRPGQVCPRVEAVGILWNGSVWRRDLEDVGATALAKQTARSIFEETATPDRELAELTGAELRAGEGAWSAWEWEAVCGWTQTAAVDQVQLGVRNRSGRAECDPPFDAGTSVVRPRWAGVVIRPLIGGGGFLNASAMLRGIKQRARDGAWRNTGERVGEAEPADRA